MMEFSQKDLEQLQKIGVSKENVLNQVDTFKEGIPFVRLEKAAVVGEGIFRFSAEEQEELVAYFEAHRSNKTLLKFVPASGAASRMFKALFNFLDTYDSHAESLSTYLERTSDKAVKRFLDGLKRFPFSKKITTRIESKHTSEDEMAYLFVQDMLTEAGLNYGFYPKGLLPFHEYGETTATPFEEHLKEAALYANTEGKANLHFTISPQHNELFKKEEAAVSNGVSKKWETQFNISYSNQKPSTDTIAVDMQNNPFRNGDGSILFRPGGHGALIENLNEQHADIIFIKNIDNVVTEKNLQEVSDSKKMLAGLLLKTQKKAFQFTQLLNDEKITAEVLTETQAFLEAELNVRFHDGYRALGINDKIAILKDKLKRPIRICGMVKNEGEPGGGPFWVSDQNKNISLQIIESAQVDLDDQRQSKILKQSTHFNPVDLVCGVKDYKGEKYDLLKHVDTKQGFITEKTKEGKALKALELPGLWNGAMAYWNTIFVEVPLVTFNPVKTVNDLLKPSHQSK